MSHAIRAVDVDAASRVTSEISGAVVSAGGGGRIASTGVGDDVKVPLPSCPDELSPQPWSELSAMEDVSPAAIVRYTGPPSTQVGGLTFVRPTTGTGVSRVVNVPSPSRSEEHTAESQSQVHR